MLEDSNGLRRLSINEQRLDWTSRTSTSYYATTRYKRMLKLRVVQGYGLLPCCSLPGVFLVGRTVRSVKAYQ